MCLSRFNTGIVGPHKPILHSEQWSMQRKTILFEMVDRLLPKHKLRPILLLICYGSAEVGVDLKATCQ